MDLGNRLSKGGIKVWYMYMVNALNFFLYTIKLS